MVGMCKKYHWTPEQVMSLTIGQLYVLMLDVKDSGAVSDDVGFEAAAMTAQRNRDMRERWVNSMSRWLDAH
jgi:hypothetical protein